MKQNKNLDTQSADDEFCFSDFFDWNLKSKREKNENLPVKQSCQKLAFWDGNFSKKSIRGC